MNLNPSSQVLSTYQRLLATTGGNVANKGVIGGKSTSAFLLPTVAGGQTGAPTILNRAEIGVQGDVKQTGIGSDLMIQGKGMFVYQDANGDITFERGSSNRLDKDGNLVNLPGRTLMGWALDKDGKVPANASTLGSLTPINLRGVVQIAKPTTYINLGINLAAKQKLLPGAGDNINMVTNARGSNPLSFYARGATDPIIPGNNGPLGELHPGDQITTLLPNQNTPSVFEYGGMAISGQISVNSGVYGTTDPNTAFTPVLIRANGTSLVEGDGIKVNIGAQQFEVRFSSSSTSVGKDKFNSLSSLANALNHVAQGSLTAEMYGGRLYIVPKDANQAITFTDSYGGNIVANLQLDNTIAATGGVLRFATIEQLQQQMKSVAGLRAVASGPSLDFGALDARQTLQLGGKAQNIRTAFRAYTAGMTIGGINPVVSNRLVTIGLNNHGFSVGDYVRISGLVIPVVPAGGQAGTVDGGVYRVLSVTGDAFDIAPTTDCFPLTAQGDIDAATAAGQYLKAPNAAPFTVQKVDGSDFVMSHANFAGIASSALIAGGGGIDAAYQRVTINLGVALPVSQNIGVGDEVYITGSANGIAAGYYKVSAIAANTFSVDIPQTQIGNGAGAAVVGGADAGLKVVKTNGRAAAVYDTLPVQLENLSSIVTINVGAGRNHAAGDAVSFNMAADVVVDGIVIKANTYYTVLSPVGATSIRIDTSKITAGGVTTNVASQATSDAAIGFTNTFDTTANANALAAAPGTTLGADAYINYTTREFSAFGMTNKSAGTFNAPLAATYDASNPLLNMTGGHVNDSETVFTTSVSVVNSLGNENDFDVQFVKLSNLQWAVEISAHPDKNGNLPIITTPGSTGKPVVYGTITFNGEGKLASVDGALSGPITVQYNDGADPGSFTFNWGALNGAPGALGVTQINTPQSVVNFIDSNGTVPGGISDIEYGADGTVTVIFSNGGQQDIFKVAVADFASIDELKDLGGKYIATNASGKPILKVAGTGGVGEIISKAVEGSTVDTNAGMLDAADDARQIGVNVAVQQAQNRADDATLRLGSSGG